MFGVTMITHPGYQKPTNTTTDTINSNFGFVSCTIIVVAEGCEWIQTQML